MMFPGLEHLQRSVVRVVVGLGCAAAAFVLAGTLAAGMLWIAALAIACLGYGGLVDRITGHRWSTPITMATGMALLFVVSTLLARFGLLIRPVQLAAVITGIGLCLLPGTLDREPRANVAIRLYAAVAAVSAIGLALLAARVPFGDTFNHVMLVKRLWDTGHLGFTHHQSGLQVVGESYVSLMSGAGAADIFELGGCAALLVYLLSFELGTQPGPIGLPLALLFTVPIVVWPSLSEQWSGAVLYVAMFITLQRAREASVRGWHACVLSLALMLLRHEYLVVGLPFIVSALGPAWSRRNVAIAITLWFVLLIPYQLALAVPATRAVFNAALLVVAIPVVSAVRRLVGARRGPDALDALAFASVMYGVALLIDAIRRAQHSDGAIATVCFGGAACIAWLLARQRDTRHVHLGGATVALALVVGYTVTGPNFDNGRYVATDRVIRAAVALRQTLVFGGPHSLETAVAQLQTAVPRGARIGFWGESAGELDYRRNPVTDLTRSGKRNEVMVPMTPGDVRRVDYVLLENLEPGTAPDAWDPHSAPTSAVESMLELRAASDGAFLFRVRR